MAHGADVAQYKKVLMKAAAENDLMILRPYLEQTGNQWEELGDFGGGSVGESMVGGDRGVSDTTHRSAKKGKAWP